MLPYDSDFAAILPFVLGYEADLAAILPLFLLYEADSAAILLLVLPYDCDFAAILPFILLYEADLAAILPLLLLYDVNFAANLLFIPSYESHSVAIVPFPCCMNPILLSFCRVFRYTNPILLLSWIAMKRMLLPFCCFNSETPERGLAVYRSAGSIRPAPCGLRQC